MRLLYKFSHVVPHGAGIQELSGFSNQLAAWRCHVVTFPARATIAKKILHDAVLYFLLRS